MSTHKQPRSVLVLIHNPDLDILLLERADWVGFWQSVTGSIEEGETPVQAAVREVTEETAIQFDVTDLWDWQRSVEYDIFEHWRHRYAPGVHRNTEHHFSLCVERGVCVALSKKEHIRYQWVPWKEAAVRVFSPSNGQIIRDLARAYQMDQS